MATSSQIPLGEGDLLKLYNELYPVSHKYRSLGLQLGLRIGDIENIEVLSSDAGNRLLRILSDCLKMPEPLTWDDIVRALRSPSANEHRLADDIQQRHGTAEQQPSRTASPLTKEKEAMALYEKAMKKGFVESALALLILVGVTGAGKSLFKCLVLGLPIPDDSPSTPLAASAVRSMSICQVAVDVKWVEVGPQKMMDMVARAIKEGVPILESVEDLAKLAFQPPTQLEQGEKGSSKLHSQPQETTQGSSATFSAAFLDALKGMNIDWELIQKVTEPSSTVSIQKLMDVDFLYLLDSGGQPPFREMLPHFVQQASATVLFQKLNERLDFKPTIRYREEGGKADQGYTSQLTNEQILHQYVQGVQSHNSKVFVVGTHRDKETECEGETRETKNEKLLEAFRPILSEQMELYKVGGPDQLMFPLNCKAPKKEDETTANKFRKRVIDTCMGLKVKIPLPWFVLEQLLQLLAQKMGVKVLKIEECFGAAKQKLLMPRNVCEAAITYLGKLNIIFYSPSILPGVVFSNAQVVLDKITELVRCSIALRTNSESSTDAVPSCMESSEKLEFRDFGQVSSKLLEKAFPSHYRDNLFEAQHLLELLEGLLIAGKLENGKHFIPSLLTDLQAEGIAKHRVMSAEHPAPLVIHYPSKWVPVGVMPSLTVYLRNICRWELSQKHGEPACLYHNCIQFRLPGGKPGNLALIDSTKFLEIHVKTKFLNLCPEIRESIMNGLEEAHKSLHYDLAQAEIGFLCSGDCDNEEAHLATLDDKRETWVCSEDEGVGEYLDQRQKYWFLSDAKKGCPSSQTDGAQPKRRKLTKSLDIDNLFEVVSALTPVTARWRPFGLALGVHPDTLNVIEKENQRLDDCLTEVLTLWLKKSCNTAEPSWELLAKAVGHRAGGNDSALAEELTKRHEGV